MPFVTVKRPFAARRRLSRKRGFLILRPFFYNFFCKRKGTPDKAPPLYQYIHKASPAACLFLGRMIWFASHIRADAADNARAVLQRRYTSAVMLLRRAPMAFFSSRETCACEMPTSPEISVCVLPSK